MARRAVRVPKDLKFKQLHAVVNFNERQRNSIGQRTLQTIMDHGIMYVEDYVDLCESQGIPPAQAIKELRVDIGFQRVALENSPKFVDPMLNSNGKTQEKPTNGVSNDFSGTIPKNLQDLALDLNNREIKIRETQANLAIKEKEITKTINEAYDFRDRAEAKLKEATLGSEAQKTLADPKNNNGIIHPPEWDKLLSLANIRQNILLTGPSGCGKTHISKVLAEELGLQFGFISCTAGISESEFRGRIVPNISNGSFTYVPSVFVKLYEEGGVLLLDELDASDGNTIIFINSALANDEIYIDIRDKNPLVKRHKDFVCIAACNTFGHGADDNYSERNKLDMATLDRFRAGVVEMDYNVEVEKLLVNKNVLKWGLKIRDIINEYSFQHTISTRVMIDYSKQADSFNWGRREWERSFFADWSEDEKRIAESKNAKLSH